MAISSTHLRLSHYTNTYANTTPYTSSLLVLPYSRYYFRFLEIYRPVNVPQRTYDNIRPCTLKSFPYYRKEQIDCRFCPASARPSYYHVQTQLGSTVIMLTTNWNHPNSNGSSEANVDRSIGVYFVHWSHQRGARLRSERNHEDGLTFHSWIEVLSSIEL